MTALAIGAPTDAQLGYSADLCAKQGLEPPRAIHTGSYAPERYAPDADLPEALRPS